MIGKDIPAPPGPDAGDSTTFRVPGHDEPIERIGPYRLREVLGEGGMGVVYLAEQQSPVRRLVALKIIKLGMDTREVIGRFEAERQALALMNHPHIAQVFDAGATEAGRPYFVMEHVPGVPITDYCDRHRLSTRERLALFIPVCQAIHHAHQKGIIHRDLKPSNVLVAVRDGQPVAKVIDFGVAKATDKRLTEKTVFTEQGRLIGTPEYMSPEQAEMTGLNVDTTSDVYSLGVLLYELLTGTLPFSRESFLEVGLGEIHRVIREVDPPRPSTRISSLGEGATWGAGQRRTLPQTWMRQVRGELDWITMRALEKDRTRRYQSASEFAADIGRHLADEAVLARRPSGAYQLRKLVVRHKVRAGLLGLLVVVVAGFGVGMTVQAGRIARERDRANQEAETAHQVSEFLVGLFEVSDPNEARGNTITAREILDEGAARIARELADQPLVQARLMATMGQVYRSLGLYDQARPLLEQALGARENLLGIEHPDVAASLNNLANLLVKTGDFKGARPLFERALAIRERTLGPEHPGVARVLNNLAILRKRTGDLQGARPLYERSLAIREQALGPDHPDVAKTMNNLANLLVDAGDFEGARPLYERSLAIREKTLGPDHPYVASSLNNLAILLEETGDFEGARPLYERALAIREKVLDPDHPDVAQSLDNLAILHKRIGDYEQARPLFERALTIREKALGPDHPDVASNLNNLAGLLLRTGDNAQALRLYERVLVINEQALGPGHPEVGKSLNNLAILVTESGDHARARSLLERSLTIREQALGPDHPDVAQTLHSLASLRLETGDLAGARTSAERSLAIREQAFGTEHPDVARSLSVLAKILSEAGDPTGARRLHERALAIWENSLDPGHPDLLETRYRLACLAARQGDSRSAIAHLRQAVQGGYEDQEIGGDPDLDSLHGDPEFEAILAEVRERNLAR